MKQSHSQVEDLIEILENSFNEIYIFSQEDYKFLYCNKTAVENLGYSISELKTMTPWDLKPEFTQDLFKRKFYPLLADHVPFLSFETIHKRKDESTYPVEVRVQKSMFRGEKTITAMILDVTTMKKQQSEHQKNQKLLKEAQSIAKIGSWCFDTVSGEITWSDQMYRIFPEDKDKGEPSFERHRSTIHTDDVENWESVVSRCLEDGLPYEMEFRTVHEDGKVIYIQAYGRGSFDASGKVVRLSGTCQDITDRKKQDTFMKDTVDQLPSVFYAKDIDGNFLIVNQVFRDLFKLEDEEIIGKDNHEIFPKEIADQFRQNDLEIIEKKSVIVSEEMVHDFSGDLKFYRSYKYPYINEEGHLFATGGISVDITDQKIAEEKLKLSLETERIAYRILEISASNQKLKDKLGEILNILTNIEWRALGDAAAVYQISSESEATLINSKNFSDDFVTENQVVQIERDQTRLLKTNLNGLTTSGSHIIELWNQEELFGFILFTSKSNDFIQSEKETIQKLSKAMMDVIIRAKAQEELEQQKMIAQHQAKLASIGELAAGVGHEINNPLVIISGGINRINKMLKKGEVDLDKLTKATEKIASSSSRIENIVKGLRNFSRVDQDDHCKFSLNELISESVALVQEIYQKEKISLTFETDDSLNDPFVIGNRGKIQQVVMNLITNAKDALEKIEDGEIIIKLTEHEGQVLISVSDNGHGIPIEIQEKIFDPFFTTKEVNKGTGIGLALSHSIIREHRGKIQIKNSSNKGTTFEISLPTK